MRKIVMTAVAALSMAAVPAAAQDAGGLIAGVIGGFESSATTSFNVNTSVEGLSASGYQLEVGFGDGGSLAGFASTGEAGSSTTVTPFNIETNSYHSGGFVGGTLGEANLDGQVMSFGQSSGEGGFDASVDTFQSVEGGFAAIGGFVSW